MDIAGVADIAELNHWMREHNLQGYWDRDERHSVFQPYLWKWAEIGAAVQKAAEVVPVEQAFRRNISLRNPRNTPGTLTNVILGVQCVLPGEAAPSHRHSAAAIRFVIKGSPDAYTVCDGEPMPLEEGDLITNPHYTFHGHVNKGKDSVIWIDGLDVRLATLGKEFRQDYPSTEQEFTKPIGHSLKTLGHARPSGLKATQQPPPFRYPWKDTQAALTTLIESETPSDPCDGYRLTYSHPLHGGPTLPTFACEIQQLPRRFAGNPHRHNSVVIYHVFRGEGVTTIDGQRYEWSKGDFFVIPAWAEHRHENPTGEDAILFSVCDYPAMQALGIYREETPDA